MQLKESVKWWTVLILVELVLTGTYYLAQMQLISDIFRVH